MVITASMSCKKCVTCTESHSGYSSDYCGTTLSVNKFEDDLKTQGAAVGQSWSCRAQ